MPHDPAIPLLLPTPRSIRLTGGTARRPIWLNEAAEDLWRQSCGQLPKGQATERIRAETHESEDESDRYSIRIERGPDGIAKVSLGYSDKVGWTRSDRRGLRHAAATLRQIVHACADDLPCLEIEDSPVGGFASRGVMLDASRDKVPTMAHLRQTIDLLASLKFNHLQFYTEHTFAYPGHEEVWKECSPITPDEARELAAYSAARGIELAANQNCFGHLASWLKRPRYQHLAEIEGDNPWYFHQWERRGPFSLCPTEPKAEAFVNELLNELLPCFQSGLVNIGCDETFDVGWGRSKAEVEHRAQRAPSVSERDAVLSRARAELYFEFVAKIAAACAKHHKRPMMWADIALTHPELLGMMPPGMIGLAWWYEPTDKFTNWIEAIRGAGHEAWVCPGTSSWRTFTGRTTERRANIADAAEQGAKAGATGFLICDWGDMGHRQQWPITLAGLAQAAEAAWNPANARTFDPRATAIHVLHEAPEVGPWLDELGDCDHAIRASAGVLNGSALFNDLHPPVPAQLKAGNHEVGATIDQWQAARDRIAHLRASRPPITDDLTRAELDHALDCAEFAADHAIATRGGPPLRGGSDLIARAESIRAEHERLWLARNRPGGMSHASSFYTKVIHDLRSSPAANP